VLLSRWAGQGRTGPGGLGPGRKFSMLGGDSGEFGAWISGTGAREQYTRDFWGPSTVESGSGTKWMNLAQTTRKCHHRMEWFLTEQWGLTLIRTPWPYQWSRPNCVRMGKLVTSMHGCGEPSSWGIFLWDTCKGARMATNAFAFVTHVLLWWFWARIWFLCKYCDDDDKKDVFFTVSQVSFGWDSVRILKI
jgi:hypothetical protein